MLPVWLPLRIRSLPFVIRHSYFVIFRIPPTPSTPQHLRSSSPFNLCIPYVRCGSHYEGSSHPLVLQFGNIQFDNTQPKPLSQNSLQHPQHLSTSAPHHLNTFNLPKSNSTTTTRSP